MAVFIISDTEIILRHEIQDLKKNLNKKNSFLIMAEKLASLQLYDAYNQINNLTHISTTQVRNQMIFQASLMKYELYCNVMPK